MALQPIAYTLKDGDSGRIHMGFGAQQVAQAAAEHGMGDLSLYQAVVVEPDGSERYFREGVQDENLCWGLNYSELIAPLVRTVQELETRLSRMEQAVHGLSGQTNETEGC